jgi:predicted CoA-substrate-specific enzyme activase
MKNNETYRTGIDVGSTTLKTVVLDNESRIVYKNYLRHKADINRAINEELSKIDTLFPHFRTRICLTGSAGMGIAERLQLPFVQEVIASIEVIKRFYPDTHTLIDLGGEDAKIVFFEQGRLPNIRMNGSCAGGTGAFIDQMADLLNLSLTQMSEQAEQATTAYNVASRCGVFAKTDVQNLIARGIAKADIALSVFRTVAMQTVTSLLRGNTILPKALCIGGPLTFIPALRRQFRQLLNIDSHDMLLPPNSEYFPALGSALIN